MDCCKNCTIRLGDKTDLYAENNIVEVTIGKKYMKRISVYRAFIDQIIVKPIKGLTSEDLAGENLNFNSPSDLTDWFKKLHEKDVTLDDTVTVIYFSKIFE